MLIDCNYDQYYADPLRFLPSVDKVTVTEESLQQPNTRIYQITLSRPLEEIDLTAAAVLGSPNFDINSTNLVIYNTVETLAGSYSLSIVLITGSSVDDPVIGYLVIDVLPPGNVISSTLCNTINLAT